MGVLLAPCGDHPAVVSTWILLDMGWICTGSVSFGGKVFELTGTVPLVRIGMKMWYDLSEGSILVGAISTNITPGSST